MIINLRGTSGSGKSTLARLVIGHFGCLSISDAGRVVGYRDPQSRMHVIGSYVNECGGCDTIKTQDETVLRVKMAAEVADNVLFEGAVVSTIAQRYLDLADTFRGKFIFAILDTPLDVCLDRVRSRRLKRGDVRELDPFTTIQKYNAVQRFGKSALEKGYDVRWIDHTKPLAHLLGMIE